MNKVRKGKSKKNRILLIILIVFIAIFIFSGYKIITWMIDNRDLENQINDIVSDTPVKEVNTGDEGLVNKPSNSNSPYWSFTKMNMMDVDFTELLKRNEDTVGWIKVNGTKINYPFVQTKDNKYYLNRSFDKKKNRAGWVFADFRNNMEEFDRNTIIYAHGRINGTMFGSLKEIINSNWNKNENNHVVKISTLTENTLWQVFSVYRIPNTSDYLKVGFNNNKDFLDFIKMLEKRSKFNFNAELDEDDKIITLSTCYYNDERVVLHAKLIKRIAK